MRFTTQSHPDGGATIHDGPREIGWMRSRDDALYVARKLNQRFGGPAGFERAEEDRMDLGENSVSHLAKARAR